MPSIRDPWSPGEGGSPPLDSVIPRDPAVLRVEWEWLHPFLAILHFGGWTVDDVLSRPDVARAVAILWKVHKTSQRLAREQRRPS